VLEYMAIHIEGSLATETIVGFSDKWCRLCRLLCVPNWYSDEKEDRPQYVAKG
jgi:hypothetical protein